MALSTGVAASLIVGTLLTVQVKDMPYTVALSPATVARQEKLVDSASALTHSPYAPIVSPYRTTGQPIILGDGGTRVYLQPNLPANIKQLPPIAIEQAELHLPVRQRSAAAHNGSVTFGAYQITQPWTQAGTNFNAPAFVSSPTATDTLYYDALGQPGDYTATVTGAGQTLNLDITWLVRRWLSGSPNYGIMVRELYPGETTQLWWEAAAGVQPEMVLTVRQEYMPQPQHASSRHPEPEPVRPYHSSNVSVSFGQLAVSASAGGSLFAGTTEVTTDNGFERFSSSGLGGFGTLRLDAIELGLEGDLGSIDDIASDDAVPPTGGTVADMTLLGSLVLPLGKTASLVPGIGIKVDHYSLTSGAAWDETSHSRTFTGLILAGELRWLPQPQTELALRLAAIPGAVSEQYRHEQGASWVIEETAAIASTRAEGRIQANVQLLPNMQISAGYTAAAAFSDAQMAQYQYSDSAGNHISGSSPVSQTATISNTWHIGAVYRF